MLLITLCTFYLFIGAWSGLTVAMIIAPETQNNPVKFLPNWARLILMILSGLIWPVTMLVFGSWIIYSKVMGK